MTGIRIIKIFLASSSELKDDREQFEIFINRKNKEYIKKGIFLELVIWEDFLDAMSATRLQDEYNKAINDCDVFVSLFKTKVGQYTEEEFLKALETFKTNQKPLIYTYFKDSQISISQITDEISSLLNFKKKLRALGHYYKAYEYISEFKHLFDQQLNKLIPKLANKIETIYQLEKQELQQSQVGVKESAIIKLKDTIRLKQKQIEELTKNLEEVNRSHSSQLEQINIASSQEKEKLKQSLQSQIRQLEQKLEQERSSFSVQQTNFQAAQAQIVEKESIIAQLQQQIKQLKSDPKTIAKDKVELKSEKGIDYTKLRDLLAAGEWKKADKKTNQVMLEAASREVEGWFREQDIANFPCVDLRTINQLWLHYSDGKFGFSIQKEIYENLGGTREYDEKVWNAFSDSLGWRKGRNWLVYDKLTFNLVAPKAHLPYKFYESNAYISNDLIYGVASEASFSAYIFLRKDL